MLFSIIFVLQACQSLSLGLGEQTPNTTSSGADLKQDGDLSAPKNELDTLSQAKGDLVSSLEIAKLSTRLDELESTVLRQQERIHLLEKGLMLGIVPDELKIKDLKNVPEKSKESLAPVKQPLASDGVSLEQDKMFVVPEIKETEHTKKPDSQDLIAYRRLVQAAQDKFNAANYGQAIALYNEVGATYDSSLTEGSHLYWIGLSWFYLKEYQLAELSFKQLIDSYSQSKWNPYARFYLAKVDQVRGLSKRALETMRQLVEEFPNQDLGEMAKSEIIKLQESL